MVGKEGEREIGCMGTASMKNKHESNITGAE